MERIRQEERGKLTLFFLFRVAVRPGFFKMERIEREQEKEQEQKKEQKKEKSGARRCEFIIHY